MAQFTFTASATVALHSEIEAALNGIAQKYGLDVKVHKSVRDREGNYARIDLRLTAISEGGQTLGPEVRDWAVLAPLNGFQASDLNTDISLDKETYTIIGWRASAPKRPILLKNKRTGKNVVAPVSMVKLAQQLRRAVTA